MTRSASGSPPGSEFDRFLLAPITEDRNGMLLSVLSALARRDIDPWEEAAKLARLPAAMATQRLAAMLATLPDGLLPRPDPATTAARLVALLPRGEGPRVPTRETRPGIAAAGNSRAFIFAIFYLILMAFMIGVQWIAAGRQAQLPVDQAAPPDRSAVASGLPGTHPGQ